MQNRILVFTHGQKNKGGNPRMTPAGFKQVESLQRFLPEQISEVWVGEAERHWDVALALGLDAHDNIWYSATFGATGSYELIAEEEMLVLGSGRAVPWGRVTTPADGAPSVTAKLFSLLHDAVVCGGREIILALGETIHTAKSGAVYEIIVHNSLEIEYSLLAVGSVD